MGLTDEQIIELTAVKVQEIVVPKVEDFTDGVAAEIHKIHLELKDSKEFNSSIISQLNDMRADLGELQPFRETVKELHTLFCKNGYMQRLNKLVDVVAEFFKTRAETCPIHKDVQAIRAQLDADRKEALSHAEGKLRTREQDKVLTRRWRVATYVSVSGVIVAGVSLATKLLGWW